MRSLLFEINSLVIFKNIKHDKIVVSLMNTLSANDYLAFAQGYSNFISLLYEDNITFAEHIKKLVLEDENVFVKNHAKGIAVDNMVDCLNAELVTLAKLCSITSTDVKSHIYLHNLDDTMLKSLPNFDGYDLDVKAIFNNRLMNVHSTGYGIYARYNAFTISGEEVVPVKNADATRLSQLKDYELEKKLLVGNTLALLNKKPCANVLLYGDRGTGKSSTVKAVVNEYAKDGLRIIEIKKEQLQMIPKLTDQLADNPLKFILFIDDLSFTHDDDNFGALKAVLEGSLTARPQNIAVYATSNRRHLVKENFSDRNGDDVHINDTLQQMLSLSDRFGITISFSKPDKNLFLSIVHQLANEHNIAMDSSELERKAEAFAIAHSGRSPRVAKQFIEQLVAVG